MSDVSFPIIDPSSGEMTSPLPGGYIGGDIPKFIHLTYKSFEGLCGKWASTPQKWADIQGPNGWIVVFWSDSAINKFVKAKDECYYNSVFCKYPYPIQRVDAFRYFLLAYIGGVYSDLDIYPRLPIDDYISSGSSVFLSASGITTSIYTNSFMVSEPNTSLFELTILPALKKGPKFSLTWWACFSKHITIMQSTGPMFFDTLTKSCAEESICVLPARKFSPIKGNYTPECKDYGNVLVHLTGSSWCSLDSNFFVFLGMHTALCIAVIIIFIILIVIIISLCVGMYRGKYKECEVSLKACRLIKTS